MSITRRSLIRSSATSGDSLATGGAVAGTTGIGVDPGYGRLAPDPEGILDLPTGFSYKVVATDGDIPTRYDDGQRFAADAGRSASFAIDGDRTVVVTNHELEPARTSGRVPTTFDGRDVPTYDPGAVGGTSNIVLGGDHRVESIFPSLAGTSDNCGGGPTPWGTWLTCERSSSFVTRQHGYVFEVDPAGTLTTAEPYRAMGRFDHEGVAVDPSTSTVYLTEKSSHGVLYRFVPNDTSMRYGSLGDGGVLSAMRAEGLARLSGVRTIGTSVDVSWTAIADPDRADLSTTLDDATVTRSPKLERVWVHGGTVHFASSYESIPGVEPVGQIWALDAASDRITLVAYLPTRQPSPDRSDDVTVSPWGQMILCEDGDDEQYLVGLEPCSGDLWALARTAGGSEFAGANFSPDGNTLYVNIKNPSTTLAVTGPWRSTRRSAASGVRRNELADAAPLG